MTAAQSGPTYHKVSSKSLLDLNSSTKLTLNEPAIITAHVRSTTEGYSFTLLVCSRGGGSGQSSRGGGGSGPAGGGVRCQVQLLGGVRSSCWGGGLGPAAGGGSGPGGWVSPASGGGVSILRPLAGGMALAFTQEDFFVHMLKIIFHRAKVACAGRPL